MKILILLLGLLSLIVNTLETKPDKIRRGDKAIIFQLNENQFIPAAFMGGIGYQFYTSSIAAFRIPLGFAYSHTSEDKPTNAMKDKILDKWSLRLTPGARFNFGFGYNIYAYAGAQLMFEYNYSKLTGKNFTSDEESSSAFAYGFSPILGGEWFADESFSISLEYSPFLKFSNGFTEYKSEPFVQKVNNPAITEFSTFKSAVVLVVSFYFD